MDLSDSLHFSPQASLSESACSTNLDPDGLGNPSCAKEASWDQPSHIAAIPDDVLESQLIHLFDAIELCTLAQVSKRFRTLSTCEGVWKALYEQRWGKPLTLNHKAAKLAGGWRHLYASKSRSERQAAPWTKPCEFELQATLDNLTKPAETNPDKDMIMVFLLDGSGSVHEARAVQAVKEEAKPAVFVAYDDFIAMVDFVRAAITHVQAVAPQCKVAVAQFSNDVRIEYNAGLVEPELFEKSLRAMVRMNGGTNIALAIQKAGQIMKQHASEGASRNVVLITDGRVDSYQAREARQMADRLVDEQQHVSMFAFGVGRGVDKAEMLHIIRCTPALQDLSSVCTVPDFDTSEQYMDLYVRDDAPW